MAINLLAFVLAGGMAASGMALGDSGAKVADKLPQPATTPAESRLEKAARDFRIQTYETFHIDRAEYDRRQAEGARIQKDWSDAGGNEAEQGKLIDWLTQATTCSQTDAAGDLPAAPKFTVMPRKKQSSEALVEASQAESTDTAAEKIDGLLHVKPVAATGAAASSLPAIEPSADGAPAPGTKSSLIGSLPTVFGAEISRTLHGLSGNSASNATPQGR